MCLDLNYSTNSVMTSNFCLNKGQKVVWAFIFTRLKNWKGVFTCHSCQSPQKHNKCGALLAFCVAKEPFSWHLPGSRQWDPEVPWDNLRLPLNCGILATTLGATNLINPDTTSNLTAKKCRRRRRRQAFSWLSRMSLKRHQRREKPTCEGWQGRCPIMAQYKINKGGKGK